MKLFSNPDQSFWESISRLPDAFIKHCECILNSENKKDNSHQMRFFESLYDLNHESLLLMYNVHRFLTGHSGYESTPLQPSSDVAAFFQLFDLSSCGVPTQGLIVLDQFVFRNILVFVESFKKCGLDLGRLAIRAPKAVFLAQLLTCEEGKEKAIDAVEHLDEGLLFLGNASSQDVWDIPIPIDRVSALFSTRTLAVLPNNYSSNKEVIINNYLSLFGNLLPKMNKHGIMFLYNAIGERHQGEYRLELVEGKRKLAKFPPTWTNQVAQEVISKLQTQGLNLIRLDNMGPQVKNDHNYDIQALILRK